MFSSTSILTKIFIPIKTEKKLFESEFKKSLSFFVKKNRKLQPIFYQLLKKPGKRLRPMLAILSAKALGIKKDHMAQLITTCVAIELIHNASLIHDDIIDDAATRRGLPAIHASFGQKVSVLSGDLLYTIALQQLNLNFNKQIFSTLIDTIQKMSEGEIINILSPAKNNKTYFQLIFNKTAYFTGTSSLAGALCANANKEQQVAMESFGTNFGMAYQLLDDYKDGDLPAGLSFDGSTEIKKYVEKSYQNLSILKESPYKKSLNKAVDYISSMEKEYIK